MKQCNDTDENPFNSITELSEPFDSIEEIDLKEIEGREIEQGKEILPADMKNPEELLVAMLEDLNGFFVKGAGKKAKIARERGETGKKFDWIKAKRLIEEYKATEAFVGLQEDWKWTAAKVWENGKPTKQPICVQTSSIWATPVLRIGNKEFECWIPRTSHEDEENTWWPEEVMAAIDVTGSTGD